MHLAKRTERGWIVRCGCAQTPEFAVRWLRIAVECPSCGQTALSSDLSTEYWSRTSRTPSSAVAAAGGG